MIQYASEYNGHYEERSVLEKPSFIKKEHLILLNALEESAALNMFISVPYLLENDPELSADQAQQVLIYWLKSYNETSSFIGNL